VGEWNALLRLPVRQIRTLLTSRDVDMYRLRLSSPFALVDGFGFADQTLRRRIYKAAKRIAERRLNRALQPPRAVVRDV